MTGPRPGPHPDAQWQVWYQDTFDRECPRQVDVSGQGLVAGLAELWARHLFETVRADGSQGFSRFNLWWKQRSESVVIAGDWGGMVRLRKWLFGEKQRMSRGYVGEADAGLLLRIVTAHAHLTLAGQTSEPIFSAAMASADRKDFEDRLLVLRQED